MLIVGEHSKDVVLAFLTVKPSVVLTFFGLTVTSIHTTSEHVTTSNERKRAHSGERKKEEEDEKAKR